MPGPTMTWAQVGAWRMDRHHLTARAPRKDLLDVVSDVCGLHAQLMSSAELTAWARVDDLEPGAVAAALADDRTLVKSWAMRGTLHLLPLLGVRAVAGRPEHVPPLPQAGLVEGLRDLPGGARADDRGRGQGPRREGPHPGGAGRRGGRRSPGRPGLAEKLLGSWGSTLKPATYQGKLCFGPNRGRNVTFVRPDQWLKKLEVDSRATRPWPPSPAASSPSTAPPTRDDYARWFAISPAQAGKHIAALGDDVAEVDVDGTPMWMLAADVKAATTCKPAHAVRLLPAFDQYVVASTRQADNLLPGPLRARVYRPQGWLSPVLLVDGQMAGVWKHERKGTRLTVTIEPFTKLPKWATKAAEAEAASLGQFLGAEPEVTWKG